MLCSDSSLDQYFTLGSVSDHLVKMFDSPGASTILDLGAGGGALSAAAVRRWSGASITTVDIDRRVAGFLSETLQISPNARHIHHVADALDHDLPSVMNGEEFELAICNPPYSRIPWRDGFDHIISEAGLSELHAVSKEFLTSDVLFLAQILRLAKPGAEIGLIVPDGLISGLRMRPIREALMRRTDIRRVVELPRGSFKGTEAQAHVVVLRNAPPSGNSISIGRLDRTDTCSTLSIEPSRAVERLDWAYYSGEQSQGQTTLASLGAEIRRGNISSVEIKGVAGTVFHTTDFLTKHQYALELPQQEEYPAGCVLAQAGDILLARVDRKLETKICLVASGTAALSDCILRIRLPESIRNRVFAFLVSPQGREALYRTSRGVGARMLSKAALLGMELQLDDH